MVLNLRITVWHILFYSPLGRQLYLYIRGRIYNLSVFVSSKTHSLGSLKRKRDWCSLCRRTAIITQPFCFLMVGNLLLRSYQFCMGNMQMIKMNRLSISCVSTGFCYITQEISSQWLSKPLILFSIPSLHFLLLLRNMALINWVPPPLGTLKVNVHAAAFAHPMPDGNTTSIGVVLRTSDENW